MRKKKVASKFLFALTVIALLLTSACGQLNGNSGGSPSKPEQSSNVTATEPSDGAKSADPFGPLPEKTAMSIYKEDAGVPLGLPEGETLTDNKYVKVFGEKLNIDYKFPIVIKAGSDSDDKKKLMVASNDIPDVMVVNYNLFLQMQKDGMIENLTDAYDTFAAPDLRKVYATDSGKGLNMVTIEGKLYGLPAMSTINDSDPEIWLRKDWLDKLGLQPPKTLDELEVILKAFVTKDPDGNNKNDTIGLAGQQLFANASSQSFSYDGIFNVYNAYVKNWVKDTDGTIKYGSIMPQTKQALEKLHELYAQGLLYKEFPVTKEEQAAQPITAGKCGAFLSPWWAGYFPLADAVKNDPSADWRAYLLHDASGNVNAKQDMPVISVAVLKKGFKYPEALVKTINYQYQSARSDPGVCGGDPYAGWNTLPDWTTQPVSLGVWRADAIMNSYKGVMAAINGQPKEDTETLKALFKQNAEYWKKGVDWLKQNPDKFAEPYSRVVGCAPLAAEKTNLIYSEFYGVTPSMEKKSANLEKLETESMLRIIVGDNPADSFDEFVKQWNNMGGSQITKEVNDAVKAQK